MIDIYRNRPLDPPPPPALSTLPSCTHSVTRTCPRWWWWWWKATWSSSSSSSRGGRLCKLLLQLRMLTLGLWIRHCEFLCSPAAAQPPAFGPMTRREAHPYAPLRRGFISASPVGGGRTGSLRTSREYWRASWGSPWWAGFQPGLHLRAGGYAGSSGCGEMETSRTLNILGASLTAASTQGLQESHQSMEVQPFDEKRAA